MFPIGPVLVFGVGSCCAGFGAMAGQFIQGLCAGIGQFMLSILG
jgi:hypothetical protein